LKLNQKIQEENMTTFHVNRTVVGLVSVALVLAGQPTLNASAQSASITIKPMTDTLGEVNVLKTTMMMKLDGRNAQKAKVKGDMQIVFAYNTPQAMAMMEMKGPLVTLLVGKDAPAEQLTGIGIYDMGSDVFMLLDAKKDVCMTMPEGSAGDLLGDNPMESMGLNEITGSFEKLSADGFLTGRPVGTEKVNGIASTHYALDAAALKSFVKQIETSSSNASKTQFKKADVWVANDGEYLMKFVVQGVGEMETLEGFKGNVGITYVVSDINNEAFEVSPPAVCTE
jgi:hypothetical protein